MSAAKLWTAGYIPLLPVIPPGVELSARSKVPLESRGKVPGKLTPGGWVGFAKWTQAPMPTAKDIRRWYEWGASTGIRADEFPGVDIDVDHPVLAKVVEKYALEHLGPAPVRRSRGDRRLLVYSTDRPFPKYALKLRYKGEEHVVEVLCQGQQYLVAGKHPNGEEYRWEDTPLWDWDPDDLTVIRRSHVTKFFRALADALMSKGVEVKLTTGRKARDKVPPQEDLRAPSLEALAEVVERIPNEYEEREKYIAFGCAVKAAGGDEAFSIFREWGNRWEGGNDPDVMAADWAGMHPPFHVGWGWLRRLSGDAAGDDFDVDPTAKPSAPPPKQVYFSDVQFGRAVLPDCAKLRHRGEWKRFDGYWRTDETLEYHRTIEEALRKVGLGLMQEAKTEENDKVAKALRAKARYLQSRSGMSNITAILKSSRTEPEEAWDATNETFNQRSTTNELRRSSDVPEPGAEAGGSYHHGRRV